MDGLKTIGNNRDMEEQNKFEQTFMINPRNYLINEKDIKDLINGLLSELNFKINFYNNSGLLIKKFSVNNIEWYRRAFTHKSFVDEQKYLNENDGMKIENPDEETQQWLMSEYNTINYIPEESNERLEYLGDSILKACQGTYLYRRYPGRVGENNEGFLTKMRIKLEKTSRLALFAKELGFDKYILLSSYLEKLENKKQGRNNEKTLENAFEAFIGAIIQDQDISSGYYFAYHFVKAVMEKYVDFSELILINDNYKDSILKYFAKEKIPISFNLDNKKSPFDLIYTMGPTNNRVFVIAICLTSDYFDTLSPDVKNRIIKYSGMMATKISKECNEGSRWADIIQSGRVIFGVGTDVSKIKAEQEASKRGMIHLGIKLNY